MFRSSWGRRSKPQNQSRRCWVPGEQVEPGPDDESGQRLDGGEQTEQARTNVLERVDVVCRGPAGEGVEMLPLDNVER